MVDGALLPIEFDLVTPWGDDRWPALFGLPGPNLLQCDPLHEAYGQTVAWLLDRVCVHLVPQLRQPGVTVVAGPGMFAVVFSDGEVIDSPALRRLMPSMPWIAPNETVH